MFEEMLRNAGLKSGMVYATGIMTAKEVIQSVSDFRSQETIREMTERILKENNCWNNEKAAGEGDLIEKQYMNLRLV